MDKVRHLEMSSLYSNPGHTRMHATTTVGELGLTRWRRCDAQSDAPPKLRLMELPVQRQTIEPVNVCTFIEIFASQDRT